MFENFDSERRRLSAALQSQEMLEGQKGAKWLGKDNQLQSKTEKTTILGRQSYSNRFWSVSDHEKVF
jgi:hypothetical protein